MTSYKTFCDFTLRPTQPFTKIALQFKHLLTIYINIREQSQYLQSEVKSHVFVPPICVHTVLKKYTWDLNILTAYWLISTNNGVLLTLGSQKNHTYE